jgi:signal transduction histidine kinase
MQLMKLFKLLIISVLCLCIAQSCTTKKAITAPKAPFQPVWIDANFTSQSLNEYVLVCTNLSKKDLNKKDLKAWIGKNAITVSQKKDAVLLGPYRQYPEAWFYTKIINTDSLSHQLVVDEFNHIRCDAFEVFTFKNGASKHWGSISRFTPFSDYQIPFLTYAVPITIPPKDTLNLLIHTQRQYGVHEANLGISTYQTYLSENIYHFLSKIFQTIVFVICALMMFILGRIFSYKTMTYLGFYIMSLLFLHLSSWGFIDAAFNFTGIGLSGNNVATFTVFVSIVFFHPFNIELMKPVPKNEKRFKVLSYLMMGANLLLACCFFLPIRLFHTIDVYTPQIMIIWLMITIIWMFSWALIALFRTKIYYIFIGFSLAFLPFFIEQLNAFFVKSPIFILKIYHPTFIFAAAGLAIISIFLLRGKLVSRKKYEENLSQLKVSLEEIRKTEIEAIGRNLHDNVGNILASALGYMSLKKPKTDTSQNLVQEAINEIRFLSHNLVKDEDMPLLQKMESLVSRFNDFSAISFMFEDFSEGKINQLDKMMQQNIYMIIQEVFTNIIKHSKATEAFIQVFERENNTLQFTIEDDGIGIPNFTENKGIGLKNIYKRAELSQLKLTIDSSHAGTNFIIETPKIK